MTTKQKRTQPKRPRGRPVKNKIKSINVSPEEIAKAIPFAADKKLEDRRKIKN